MITFQSNSYNEESNVVDESKIKFVIECISKARIMLLETHSKKCN